MECKKIKCYEGLEDILDKYDKYIDFQYKAVINIWFPLGAMEKISLVPYYKEIFERIIRNSKGIS